MYDAEVLDILEAYGPESLVDKLERAVSVHDLVPHMVLTRDIRAPTAASCSARVTS